MPTRWSPPRSAAPIPAALFATIRARLSEAGVEMSDNRLQRKIDETAAQARAEIMAGR